MSEEPAKLSRLSHRKGKIAVGMDADFVDVEYAGILWEGRIYNLSLKNTVREAWLQKQNFTIFFRKS